MIGRPFNGQIAFGFAGIPSVFLEYRKYENNENNCNNEQKQNESKDEISGIESISDSDIGCILNVKIFSAQDFEARDDQRRIIACSRSHLDDRTIEHIKECKPSSVLKRGGCGGKILMILEGKADAYVHCSAGTKKWDTCACQCLIECVGGRLTQASGEIIDYSKNVVHENSNGVIGSWKKGEFHFSFCMSKSAVS